MEGKTVTWGGNEYTFVSENTHERKYGTVLFARAEKGLIYTLKLWFYDHSHGVEVAITKDHYIDDDLKKLYELGGRVA